MSGRRMSGEHTLSYFSFLKVRFVAWHVDMVFSPPWSLFHGRLGPLPTDEYSAAVGRRVLIGSVG